MQTLNNTTESSSIAHDSYPQSLATEQPRTTACLRLGRGVVTRRESAPPTPPPHPLPQKKISPYNSTFCREMMMCDTAHRSFRTQLAAILEKLTKAALAEISGLADECSSVLHSEISQHKSENEALKKRCYTLELQLRAARETHGYTPNIGCVGRRQHSGQRGGGGGGGGQTGTVEAVYY